MESGEIGSSIKVCALVDENLLNVVESIDDHALLVAQFHTDERAIPLGQVGECGVGHFVAAQKMQRADKRP